MNLWERIITKIQIALDLDLESGFMSWPLACSIVLQVLISPSPILAYIVPKILLLGYNLFFTLIL